jgi:hypothetical protein
MLLCNQSHLKKTLKTKKQNHSKVLILPSENNFCQRELVVEKNDEMSEEEEMKKHCSWREVNTVHIWSLFTLQISFNISVTGRENATTECIGHWGS